MKRKMNCAILENPKSLHVKERKIPKIGKGDILVRVLACAICGTDVKKYFYGHKLIKSYPIIPGHELSGEIVVVGKKAQEIDVQVDGEKETRTFMKGDKVVIAPVISCERCYNCVKGRPEACIFREDLGFSYDGGFGEYIVIPENLLKKKINPVIPIPENVPLYMAAISEPFACALHAHKKLVRPGRWNKRCESYELHQGIIEGDVVVVLGGGPLGCMHSELVKNSYAATVVITQHSEERLKIIKNMDIAHHYVLNKSNNLLDFINNITDGQGADVVITATSNPAAQVQALEIVRQGGVISFFGGVNATSVKIPTNKIHYNGPLITGTSGASPYHISCILKLMAEGKIDATKYITHLLGLHDLEKVLLVKGIPSYQSFEQIVADYGEKYQDFFYNLNLINNKDQVKRVLITFKNTILKALVIPNFPRENHIFNLSSIPNKDRKETLKNMIN